MLPKFIKSLLRLQRIAIEILESPMSRLTDCLLALSAHTYNMFARALTEEENFDSFVQLVENELVFMQGQKTPVFNPTLVSLSLKLAASDHPKAKDIAQKIAHFTFDNISAPQIVCSELSKVIDMGPTRKKG